MLRRFARASSSIFPTPPSSTILPEARANPLTWVAVTWGGIEKAWVGDRVHQRRAGCASASVTAAWTSARLVDVDGVNPGRLGGCERQDRSQVLSAGSFRLRPPDQG